MNQAERIRSIRDQLRRAKSERAVQDRTLQDLEAQLTPAQLQGADDPDAIARAEDAIERATDSTDFVSPINPQPERTVLPAFALRA